MRVMMQVTFPHETFNRAVRDETVSSKMKRILEEQRPEAVYLTDHHGRRSAVLFVDLKDASKIPWLAEPWMLTFNANIEIHPVMTPQDLEAAGLEELGKEWV